MTILNAETHDQVTRPRAEDESVVAGLSEQRSRSAIGCGSVLMLVLWILVSACGDQREDRVIPPSWARVGPEQIAEAERLNVPVAFENGLGMRFVLVPVGTFTMGSPVSEKDRRSDEDQFDVEITKPFYVQTSEVTVGQFLRFDSEHALREGAKEDEPVLEISWKAANGFAAWLSQLPDARTYVLPTEAQWEYACRAGTTTPYSVGEVIAAHQARIESHEPAPVCAYQPNDWGLYDMHGNASEWCLDHCLRYADMGTQNPIGLPDDPVKVLRGGSFFMSKDYARSAALLYGSIEQPLAGSGFRLASPLLK